MRAQPAYCLDAEETVSSRNYAQHPPPSYMGGAPYAGGPISPGLINPGEADHLQSYRHGGKGQGQGNGQFSAGRGGGGRGGAHFGRGAGRGKGGQVNRKKFDESDVQTGKSGNSFPQAKYINMVICKAAERGDMQSLLNLVASHAHEMSFVNLSTAMHRLARFAKQDGKWTISPGNTRFASLHSQIRSELDRQMAEGVGSEAGRGIAQGESLPRCWSTVAWAYGSLQVKGLDVSRTFRIIGQLSLPHLANFKSLELTNLLWGFAKVKVPDPQLFQAATRYILLDFSHFSSSNISTLIWAMVTAQQYEAEAVQRAAEEFAARVAQENTEVKPVELTNLMWGLATANLHPKAHVLLEVGGRALRLIHDFKLQELSITCWSFSRLHARYDRLFAGVAEHLVSSPALLQQIHPQGMANLLWAFEKQMAMGSTASQHIESALTALIPGCLSLLKQFKPQEFACVFRALSRMGCQWGQNVEADMTFINGAGVGLTLLRRLSAPQCFDLLSAFACFLRDATKQLPEVFANFLEALVQRCLHNVSELGHSGAMHFVEVVAGAVSLLGAERDRLVALLAQLALRLKPERFTVAGQRQLMKLCGLQDHGEPDLAQMRAVLKSLAAQAPDPSASPPVASGIVGGGAGSWSASAPHSKAEEDPFEIGWSAENGEDSEGDIYGGEIDPAAAHPDLSTYACQGGGMVGMGGMGHGGGMGKPASRPAPPGSWHAPQQDHMRKAFYEAGRASDLRPPPGQNFAQPPTQRLDFAPFSAAPPPAPRRTSFVECYTGGDPFVAESFDAEQNHEDHLEEEYAGQRGPRGGNGQQNGQQDYVVKNTFIESTNMEAEPEAHEMQRIKANRYQSMPPQQSATLEAESQQTMLQRQQQHLRVIASLMEAWPTRRPTPEVTSVGEGDAQNGLNSHHLNQSLGVPYDIVPVQQNWAQFDAQRQQEREGRVTHGNVVVKNTFLEASEESDAAADFASRFCSEPARQPVALDFGSVGASAPGGSDSEPAPSMPPGLAVPGGPSAPPGGGVSSLMEILRTPGINNGLPGKPQKKAGKPSGPAIERVLEEPSEPSPQQFPGAGFAGDFPPPLEKTPASNPPVLPAQKPLIVKNTFIQLDEDERGVTPISRSFISEPPKQVTREALEAESAAWAARGHQAAATENFILAAKDMLRASKQGGPSQSPQSAPAGKSWTIHEPAYIFRKPAEA